MSRAFLFLALISLMGCTRTASTYRLVSRGPGHVVIPPQVATAEVATRTFNVNIEGRSCTLESAPIRIQPRKTKLRVIVHRDDLLKQPPGWLADWSSQAESQGCIASGSGQALADRIVQSLPLDSTAAYRLLHADSIRSGYVELGPEVRLEIRSPIAEEGTPALDIAKISGTDYKLDVDIKGPSNTIGFELAWYCLERNAGRPGLHFTALSADRNVQGKVEHLSAPAVNHLQFPTEATSFRLFYKGDDNGVRAIVIAGATRQDWTAARRKSPAIPRRASGPPRCACSFPRGSESIRSWW